MASQSCQSNFGSPCRRNPSRPTLMSAPGRGRTREGRYIKFRQKPSVELEESFAFCPQREVEVTRPRGMFWPDRVGPSTHRPIDADIGGGGGKRLLHCDRRPTPAPTCSPVARRGLTLPRQSVFIPRGRTGGSPKERERIMNGCQPH